MESVGITESLQKKIEEFNQILPNILTKQRELDELYPTPLGAEEEKQEYTVIEPASPLNFDDSPIRIPLGQKLEDIEGTPQFLKSKEFVPFLDEQVKMGHKLQMQIEAGIEEQTLNNKQMKKDKRNMKYMEFKKFVKRDDFDTVFKMYQDHSLTPKRWEDLSDQIHVLRTSK